jgi:hypothetical protein
MLQCKMSRSGGRSRVALKQSLQADWEIGQMFRRNTLMVLGAGASCEAKLSSGDGLRVKIVNSLQPVDLSGSFRDARIQAAVTNKSVQLGGQNRWPQYRDAYRAASSVISAGLPLAPSIDHFLDAHAGNVEIELLGKLAIASTILHEERTSLLAPPPTRGALIDPNAIQGTWYAAFGRMIMQAVRRDAVADAFQNLTIVSFNYDRCIEHFLFVALQAYFAIDEKAAATALEGLRIIHPYGVVGALPWQDPEKAVPFGGSSELDLLDVAGSLKTFTESVESGTAGAIKEAVAAAETMIILGFGYHQQNMDLLNPGAITAARRVFATTGGISAWDKSTVVYLIHALLNGADAQIHHQATRCSGLFDDFRLRLSQEALG